MRLAILFIFIIIPISIDYSAIEHTYGQRTKYYVYITEEFFLDTLHRTLHITYRHITQMTISVIKILTRKTLFRHTKISNSNNIFAKLQRSCSTIILLWKKIIYIICVCLCIKWIVFSKVYTPCAEYKTNLRQRF